MPHMLAIQGSPRKFGNTYHMLEAVLAGARTEGSSGEIVHLGGLSIGECNGCHACWRGKTCPLGDDMNSLYGRIAAADILVLGTPVYWYGPTALIKAFIDRFVWFNCPEHRAGVRGKTAASVIPYEESGPDAAEPLTRMLELSFGYLEMKNAGVVLAPGAGPSGAVLKRPDILDGCRMFGGRLVRSVKV